MNADKVGRYLIHINGRLRKTKEIVQPEELFSECISDYK